MIEIELYNKYTETCKMLKSTVGQSIRGKIIKSWDSVCKNKHMTAIHCVHVSKVCTELLLKEPEGTAFNLVFTVLLDALDVLKSSSLERNFHLIKYKNKLIWREVR